jgi:hypothetical protein
MIRHDNEFVKEVSARCAVAEQNLDQNLCVLRSLEYIAVSPRLCSNKVYAITGGAMCQTSHRV